MWGAEQGGNNLTQFAFQKGHSNRSSKGGPWRRQEAISLLPKDVAPKKMRCFSED